MNKLSGQGTFTLVDGYLYEITITGGSGGAGRTPASNAGGSGGTGAYLTGWILVTNETAGVYSYDVGIMGGPAGSNEPGAGGAGGAYGGTGGNAGGGGGGATFIWFGNTVAMVAAGGGGGGSGTNNSTGFNGGKAGITGGSPILHGVNGDGGSMGGGGGTNNGGTSPIPNENTLGADQSTARSTVAATTSIIPTGGGGGVGNNSPGANSGGGGGGGYTGGGGGGSGNGNNPGGGGGGGSSFILDGIKKGSDSNNDNVGDGSISVTRYNTVKDVDIDGESIEVTRTFNNTPQDMLFSDLNEWAIDISGAAEHMVFTYTGIDVSYPSSTVAPKNVGKYNVEISFDSDEYRLDGSHPLLTLEILPRYLPVPTAGENEKAYNDGDPVYYFPGGYDEDYMGIEGNEWIEKGAGYKATVSIKFKGNCFWDDEILVDEDIDYYWDIVANYRVSGEVTLNDPRIDPSPTMSGVKISYDVDLGGDRVVSRSILTDENGKYVINEVYYAKVTIMTATKYGYIHNGGTELPSYHEDEGENNENVDFIMEFNPSDKFTVSGTVELVELDEHGDINEIIKTLYEVQVSYRIEGDPKTYTVKTTADGRYEIEVPSGYGFEVIGVSKHGLLQCPAPPNTYIGYSEPYITENVDGIDFYMEFDPPNWAISGQVWIDPEGNGLVGISGVIIHYVIVDTDGNESYNTTEVTTGTDGYYEIVALAKGERLVWDEFIRIIGIEKFGFTLVDDEGDDGEPLFTGYYNYYLLYEEYAEFQMHADFNNSDDTEDIRTYTGVDFILEFKPSDEFYITGKVTLGDPEGEGIEGVEISYGYVVEGVFYPASEPVFTDGDGVYRIDGVPSGTIFAINGVSKDTYQFIGADVPEVMNETTGVLIPKINLLPPNEKFMEFNFIMELDPGAFVVTGVVTDDEGRTLAGVTIHYKVDDGAEPPSDHEAKTGSDGRYTIAAESWESVEITGVEKEGYRFDSTLTPLPPVFTTDGVYYPKMMTLYVTVDDWTVGEAAEEPSAWPDFGIGMIYYRLHGTNDPWVDWYDEHDGADSLDVGYYDIKAVFDDGCVAYNTFAVRSIEYDIVVNGDNIYSWSPEKVEHHQDGVAVTINADPGYTVTDVTSVMMGETTVDPTDWEFADGVLTINVQIDGDIEIEATTTLDTFTVTVKLKLNGEDWDSQTVTISSGGAPIPVAFVDEGTY
ncbi:MAG: carboxypeptidase-like regulatory domain-containing protein, partial [Methanomassiliicoccaceae archaeon]|nr:carboxypeptidase-like regulatory domain-containing protein [Methanomassiliicoccaceae archaeon]